jgi:DNA-binding transcriptional LysR family regulator
MEMQQIRYFLALSETLNFTQAADRCNVTQPALTRAIHTLELELGGELLRRERKLSHLTELGERMLPLMRQCLESALAVQTMAKSIRKGETAPISIALSHTVSLNAIAPIIRELSRAFPGLQLKLRRGSGGEIAECLKSGEIELAVAGPLHQIWSRVETYRLFDEPFDLFVHWKHQLADKSLATFSDLASERFLIEVGCELAADLSERLRSMGVIDMRFHEIASQSDLLTLLEANFGIAILPVSVARSNGLRRVPLTGLNLVRTVSVYCVAGRRRVPCCATLLNMLRAANWQFDASIESSREALDGGARA